MIYSLFPRADLNGAMEENLPRDLGRLFQSNGARQKARRPEDIDERMEDEGVEYRQTSGVGETEHRAASQRQEGLLAHRFLR